MEVTEHICKDAVGSVLTQKGWKLSEPKKRIAEKYTFELAEGRDIEWDDLLHIAKMCIVSANRSSTIIKV